MPASPASTESTSARSARSSAATTGGKRGHRIAVVGASLLGAVPWALWDFLCNGTTRGTTVLLRRGLKAAPGRFEQLVREVVRQQPYLSATWYMPDPADGPGQAFMRDNEMVAAADLVLAFFDPHHVMEGGTGHVVETAIDRNVPVYSFAMSDTALTRVGDHDPDALWQQTVTAYFS